MSKTLSQNVADCLSKGGAPLTADQRIMLSGYLAVTEQQLEQAEARCAELESIVDSVGDAFGIGSKARTQPCVYANVKNAVKFSNILDAIERQFFMVPGEPDEDYPECEPEDVFLMNKWGSTETEYVHKFQAWLLRQKAESVEAARDETCNGSPMTSWHWQVLTDYAQRLRQQADELEKE